jgi:alginate O-acetyltransferase complex protein AlgI
MSLTSFSFYIIVMLVYSACVLLEKNNELKKILLLFVSYYLYMTIDWRFCFLLLALTLINYYCGYGIVKSKRQSLRISSLAFAVIGSLAILFYFKYANFFISSIIQIASFGSIKREIPIVKAILPVGISFMTFQAITYPLDLYAGRLKRQSSFRDYSLFMAFFPAAFIGANC